MTENEIVEATHAICHSEHYLRFLTRHRHLPGLPPVLSTEEFEETELQLGFGLPPLLKRLYTEVANGGFGPGYGLVGVRCRTHWWPNGGVLEFLGAEYLITAKPLVEVDGIVGYMTQHPYEEDEELFWPRGLVSLCWNEPFGDEATVSGVHCLLPGFPIICDDRFGYENDAAAIAPPLHFPGSQLMGAAYMESPSINAWLQDWVEACSSYR